MAEKQNILEIEDLKKILKIFSRNWYWFIVFPAIAYAVSYFYTHRLTDIYAAKTQIMLKSDDVYKFQDGKYGNIYSSFENSSSQIRVLQSSDLIEKAILKLDIDVSYYIIGRVKISEVYGNMPFKIVSDNFGSSAIGKEFRINLTDTNKFRLSYAKGDEEITKEYVFGEIILDNGFYFTVNRSRNLNENSVSYLSKINYMFKIHNRNQIVSKFKSEMTVQNLEWTSILEATIEDEIPERAVAFLDTLAVVYIDNTLQNKYNINANTINYIDRQLEEVTNIINGIEEEMERFKAAKEIINLSREEEESYSRLTELENKNTMLDLKLKSMEELREYVLNNSDEKFLPPSFFVLEEDPFLKSSISKLYDIQITKSNLLFKGTEKTIPAREMDSTFERVRKDVLLYMLNTQKFIEKNREEILTEITLYEEKIKSFPKTQRQIVNIERKLNINQSLYSFLLTKRAETVISRAGIIPETKVIERARSIGIVKPDKQKISGTFLMVGLALALAVSLIRFLFFEKFENINELSKATQIPILGGLPYSDKAADNYILLDSEPKAPIAEAFRTIRTNMQYLSPGKTSKIILVTSLYPEEGKTFCSANLAVIIAKANKKTLLVDLDLHRPKIHKTMKSEVTSGMSNFLIGKQSYSEVKSISNYENLDVVFSGPTPPNASELILSDKISEFFEQAKQEYEYIIIDTPPLGLINDSIVLMNFADVVLFVMNSKVASRQGVNIIESIVNKTGKKSCGIILNRIKGRKWKYYYGGYGYGYGYSYGYGYAYGYGNTNGTGKTEKKARV